MDYPQKNQRWVFHGETEGQAAGEGVERRVLAYCDDVMCVENRFVKGSIGAMHSHPHTQITYVVSGVFEFTIDGEVHTVKAGGYPVEAGRSDSRLRVCGGRDSGGYFYPHAGGFCVDRLQDEKAVAGPKGWRPFFYGEVCHGNGKYIV